MMAWQRLSPSWQRTIVVASVVSGFVLAVVLTSPDTEQRTAESTPPIRHILTDQDTHTHSIEGLYAAIALLEASQRQLQRDIDRMLRNEPRSIPRAIETDSSPDDSESVVMPPTPVLRTHESDPDANSQTGVNLAHSGTEKQAESQENHSPANRELNQPVPALNPRFKPIQHADAVAYFSDYSAPHVATVPSGPGSTISGVSIIMTDQATSVTPSSKPLPYLTAGTLISATLITGLDAPTHDDARREPFPVLLTVNTEALLPNHARVDISACFIIAAGYGDLSAERAYLRGETLSCIDQDGQATELSLDGYAVGEDGKAGLRGRLVSREGQLIARSMMAGSLQALSSAFNVTPVPTLQTGSAQDAVAYQQVLSSNAVQGAAIKGTSDALGRVASFYLDMAERLFPVIEIDATRQVDFILTRGISLTPVTVQSSSSQENQ